MDGNVPLQHQHRLTQVVLLHVFVRVQQVFAQQRGAAGFGFVHGRDGHGDGFFQHAALRLGLVPTSLQLKTSRINTSKENTRFGKM